MIRLPDAALPPRAASQLKRWQGEIDATATYPERVAKAKAKFESRNKKGNSTFDAVKATLTTMCSGARRCAYCEDSMADEVEHFRPKSFYPDLVFVWSNYLYACGICNGPKNNNFAVFSAQNGAEIHLTRPVGTNPSTITPPETGQPLLLDPRSENPLDFLRLDLETLLFGVRRNTPENQRRARYTIDILRLNANDQLIVARRDALGGYRARLHEYNRRKAQGAAPAHLNLLVNSIQTLHHPTVWREMQRSYAVNPELTELFAESPEALDW